MKATVFTHPATSEGFIAFEPRGDTVSATARWPFDLHTDEWIYVENTFSCSAYKACVQALIVQGRGTAQGLLAGFLNLERRGQGDLWIDLCDARSLRPPRLALTISGGLGEIAAPVE